MPASVEGQPYVRGPAHRGWPSASTLALNAEGWPSKRAVGRPDTCDGERRRAPEARPLLARPPPSLQGVAGSP